MRISATLDEAGHLTRLHLSIRVDRDPPSLKGERSSTVGYHAGGWLETSTDPLRRVTRYARDALGRVTKTILPDGREVRFSYTAAGDVETVSPPSRPRHVFGFTPAGLRDTWKPADDEAAVTHYRYDDDRQLSAIERPDGTTLHVDRDAAGRVSGLRHGTWSVDYDYSPSSGALSSVTADDGTRTSWTYDGDLATSETTTGPVSARTEVAYDGEGRVTRSTVEGTPAVTYDYDVDDAPSRIGALTLTRNASTGQLTGTTLGSSTTSLAYSAHGEQDSVTVAHGGSTLFGESYGRDDGGRVISKTERVGDETHAYEYHYDAAGRLESVKRDGAALAAYDYDANGNRTELDAAGAAPVTAEYDEHDRLVRHGTTTYRYTAGGELRERKTGAGASTSYDYDASGSLTGVELPDGRTIRYLTDGLGRRIGKEVGGALERGFVYGEGPLPSAELDADGHVRSRFVYATRSTVPDYMERGGRTYRLVSDRLGSVRLVVDTADGAVAQRMDYDPWGRVTADTNPGFQPFGYAGGLYDADTGLVRFGARDYDAETGRWTARDPIDFQGGDTNLYGYVLSDPINQIDPSGLIPGLDALGDAAGAVGGWVNENAGAISAVTGTAAVIVSFTPLAPMAPALGAVSVATGAIGAQQAFREGDYLGAAIDGAAAAIGGVSLAKTTITAFQALKLESLRKGAAAIPNVPATPELASLYGFNRRVQPLLDSRRFNRDFSLKYDPIAAGLSDLSYIRAVLCR